MDVREGVVERIEQHTGHQVVVKVPVKVWRAIHHHRDATTSSEERHEGDTRGERYEPPSHHHHRHTRTGEWGPTLGCHHLFHHQLVPDTLAALRAHAYSVA